jgi:YD repeat-containing protein
VAHFPRRPARPRELKRSLSGSTAIYTISYAYNADNQVTSASDPDSSYAYTYDHLGRVTSLDNSSTPNIPHVVLSSQYDAMGDRTQLTATVTAPAVVHTWPALPTIRTISR